MLRTTLLGLLLVFCGLITLPARSASSVPPDVGNYSYGFIRCDTWHDGYSSRSEDEQAGANYYYGAGCTPEVTESGAWATPTTPEGGACGGYPSTPSYFLGLETSNQTNDQVTYKYPDCSSQSYTDGISIRRIRSVSCPPGYTPNSTSNLCDTPAGINPTKNNNTCKAGCNGSDPINSATGALVVNESDYAEPNGNLHFDRTYTSTAGLFDATSLGSQWRSDYDRRITVVTSGSTTTATAYRPNGDRYHFALNNGQWIPDQDVALVLTMSNPSPGSYTNIVLIDTDGTKETYDSNGLLSQIIPLDQRILTVTHSGIFVSKVSDQHGRSLTFNYGAVDYQNQTRLNEVDTPDGLAIKYGYDSSTGNLTSVSYVGTVNGQVVTQTRSYIYGENGAPAYAMTELRDEANKRYTSWAYDAQGRATLSVHGVLTDYPSRTELTYNTDGSTTIKNWINGTTGKFATRLFNFNIVQGVAHLSGVSCSGCSSPAINLPGIPVQPASTTYDLSGYPKSSADFKNNITATQYDDASGLMVQEVDASGTSGQRTINFTWDSTLRVPMVRSVINTNNAVIAQTTWVYNTVGQPLTRCDTDPTNPVASGYVCSSTGSPPAGVRRWTNIYCTAVDTIRCPVVGLLLTVDGPRTDVSDVTSYAYYMLDGLHQNHGDLKSVTDPLGHVTTYLTYDGAGRVTAMQRPDGSYADFTYTPRGWLLTRTIRVTSDNIPASTDATNTLHYTAYGAVDSITDADGVVTTFNYDGAHRLTDIYDATGEHIHYTLDAAGNKTAEKTYNAAGALTRNLSRTYNTLGQLTAIIDGLNNTVFSAAYSDSYDPDGNLVHSADALGIQRQQGFDPLNRLHTTIANYNGTDAATRNTQTTFNYDALDRVNDVVDPSGLATLYTYDGLDNLTTLQSPDSGTSGGANGDLHDAAGNLTQHTDARGVITHYTYDALNRLTGKIYPAHPGLNVTYVYDQAAPISGCPTSFNIGHLTSMTDASGSSAWCYTGQGDVREVSQIIQGVHYLHGYAYTAGRRLAYLQYPSGFELKYGYDSNGRASTIGYLQQPGPYGSYTNSTLMPLITAVSYEPFGPVTGYSWAQGGQAVLRSYDQNYALTDITSNFLNLHFQRDTMGRVGAEGTAPGANPLSESYHYDPLNRLSELDDHNGVAEQSFTYNPTGDRLLKTVAGQAAVTYGYQTGSHRLASVGGTPRTPDANGNTIAMVDPKGNLVGLGYDDRNLLTTVTSGASTIGSYQYNGQGVRVWRTITSPSAGQAATIYDPSGTGNLYGEYFATDYREYVYLEGIPVAAATDAGRQAPSMTYLYADQLGTVRAASTTSGTVGYQWAWLNNAFGELTPTGTSNLYTRFPGQYYDVETGLHYNGNRYYDPSTGRYLESDPIGLNGGISTYADESNNPLRYADPSGLFPEPPPEDPLEADGVTPANEGMRELRQVEEMNKDVELAEQYEQEGPGEAFAPSEFAPLGECKARGAESSDAKVGPPGSSAIDPIDFAGKTPVEIDALARALGLEGKGPDPMNGRGAYVDPFTGLQRVLSHPDADPPHIHINDVTGQRLDINGNPVMPESPEAHLPIGH